MPPRQQPCLTDLFTERVHPIADTSKTYRRIVDTSLAAYHRILPTISQRERAVLLALCDAARPLTGGELAERMGVPVTSVRPRLTALKDKKLIEKCPIRRSTARLETTCHPYRAVVTRAAVERS